VGRVSSASEGEGDGTRRRRAWVLTAAEGRAVPGPSSGRRESRTALTRSRAWGGGGRGKGKRPGGEPQVLEDGLGRRGTEDDCHDAAGAPAARAGEDVGLEGPLEELGPGDGTPGRAGEYGLGHQRARGCAGPRWRVRRGGDDAGTHPSIGGEDAEVADEVGPGRRDERREATEEGHRRKDEVCFPGGRGPLHPKVQ